MPTRPPRRSAFAAYQRMAVLLVLALMAALAMYVVSEQAIDDANDNRFETHHLAQELRQSSDDLTRMVRSYLATGNPQYKQYYQDILDIRDGKKPRPLHYDHVFWDLVISQKFQAQPESGPPAALLSLMREAGFVEEEFALLALAKSRSDALTRIELQAMALVDGNATPQERAQASHMLENDAYNAAKADIMLPLNQFFAKAEQRTLDAVEAAKQRALLLRSLVVLLGLGVLWSIWRTAQAQRAVLGSTVEDVYAQIAMLGKGQLDALPDVSPAMRDSVLGRLVDTQHLLLGNEQRRAQLDARLRRLTHLYAALTECTLALTRGTTDEELFTQTCKAAVAHGGMRMAWIGLVDWDNHRVQACTAYGDGTAYLEGLHISIDPNESEGRGPTGTTVRNDQPEWCQDYQADPRTVAWHSLGRQFGWAASASLPVHRNGKVIATFNVYAGEAGAFDEDIQGLLLRMVANIDYGLHALDQNAARSQAELETRESQIRLALAYRGSQDALWDWNLKTDVLHYSPRWWEMIGYSPDAFPSDANLWRHVTHPDDVHRVTQLLREFLRSNGESFEAECRLLHSDGHIVPVLVRGFVTRDATGRAIRVSGTNMDITERVQALQMNTLRSDMLERLSSDLPLGPLLQEFARKMEDALPGTQCTIVLQDQAPAAETPAQPAHHVLQEPIRSGTNTLLGQLQIIRPTPEPARAHERALLQMAAHIAGIAIERKRAEMQLHLSSAVFEQGSEIIMITDARARMVRVNKAFTQITGYSEEEALGRNPSMLSSGRQDSAFYKVMWRSLMAQGRWQGEVWNRRKDGSVYPRVAVHQPGA